jgi:hypothetical protein
MKNLLSLVVCFGMLAGACGGVNDQISETSEAAVSTSELRLFTCPVNKNPVQIAYWRSFCSRLVQPVAPTVCTTVTSVDLKSCTCAYADTFPVCSWQSAISYLSCAIHHTSDFGCLDNNNNEFPWIVDDGQCADLQVPAFGC